MIDAWTWILSADYISIIFWVDVGFCLAAGPSGCFCGRCSPWGAPPTRGSRWRSSSSCWGKATAWRDPPPAPRSCERTLTHTYTTKHIQAHTHTHTHTHTGPSHTNQCSTGSHDHATWIGVRSVKCYCVRLKNGAMCYKVWSDDRLLALWSIPKTHLPAAGSRPWPHTVSDHQQG